jgi:hypothetical protein
MKSYKAPGPDDFQPIFFKLFWDDIGNDIWNFVKLAFETGRYDPKICETLIVLLPKGDRQVSFKDRYKIALYREGVLKTMLLCFKKFYTS